MPYGVNLYFIWELISPTCFPALVWCNVCRCLWVVQKIPFYIHTCRVSRWTKAWLHYRYPSAYFLAEILRQRRSTQTCNQQSRSRWLQFHVFFIILLMFGFTNGTDIVSVTASIRCSNVAVFLNWVAANVHEDPHLKTISNINKMSIDDTWNLRPFRLETWS